MQLFLQRMEHFAAVNAVYSEHLPAVSPAARACMQLPLPDCTALMLSVVAPVGGGAVLHGVHRLVPCAAHGLLP